MNCELRIANWAWRIGAVVLVCALVAPLGGCAGYWGHRGADAKEFLDLGVTVTTRARPDFAFYFDFFNVTPIGYAHIDNARYYGFCQRRFGAMRYSDYSWGVLLYGRERSGQDRFDPRDPIQARDDERHLTERPVYYTGVIGNRDDERYPPRDFYFECNRGMHLGWFGLHMTCRMNEMADFLLGWTTIDIMGDDDAVFRQTPPPTATDAAPRAPAATP